LEFKSLKDGVLVATVALKFVKDWIEEHYSDELLQRCAEEFGESVERVEIELRYASMSPVPER
jgi:chromosomal replication initiation ATPase DnaA